MGNEVVAADWDCDRGWGGAAGGHCDDCFARAGDCGDSGGVGDPGAGVCVGAVFVEEDKELFAEEEKEREEGGGMRADFFDGINGIFLNLRNWEG